MKLIRRIASETWAVVRYLATGRTMSGKQQAAATYYRARMLAGPDEES